MRPVKWKLFLSPLFLLCPFFALGDFPQKSFKRPKFQLASQPSGERPKPGGKSRGKQTAFNLPGERPRPVARIKTAEAAPQLISPKAQVKKGEDFLIGLHIKIPKGWHSYWSFAGDFGQSPKIRWRPLKKARIEPLPFPAPERKAFPLNGKPAYSFIYETELFIPFKVFIEEDYDEERLPLALDLQWFVCQEVCLSKEASLELNLKIGKSFKPHLPAKKIFKAWGKRLPKSLNLKSHFQIKGKKLIIDFFFEESVQCADLFPQGKADFSASPPALLNQGPRSCSFQAEQTHSRLPKISGLLIYSQKGQKRSAVFSSYERKKFAWLWFIFLAFLGGLLLNVMPCVLPIIFLKFYSVLELRHLPPGKILFLNLSYAFGVIFSFLCLAGALLASKQTGEILGWGFHLQSPVFVAFLAFLFSLMAFYLLDVISFPAPKVSLFFKDERWLAHFLTGALSTTAASPCTAPFMVSAVGYALSASPLEIFVIFFFLGVGLSFPYLALSFFPGALKYIPRPGPWTEALKKAFSLPLFLTVIWLVRILYLQLDFKMFLFSLGVFPLLLGGIICQKRAVRKGRAGLAFALLMAGFFVLQSSFSGAYKKNQNLSPQTAPPARDLNWSAFDKERLLSDKPAGKNIFIAFGAEWCLTCKLNERIFKTREFEDLAKSRRLALYYGDWTVKDREITKFLRGYGQPGVPFYIFFKGEERVFIFPALLFKDSFLRKIRELSKDTEGY